MIRGSNLHLITTVMPFIFLQEIFKKSAFGFIQHAREKGRKCGIGSRKGLSGKLQIYHVIDAVYNLSKDRMPASPEVKDG